MCLRIKREHQTFGAGAGVWKQHKTACIIITLGMRMQCPNSDSWVLLGPKLWVCFADCLGIEGEREEGGEYKGMRRRDSSLVFCNISPSLLLLFVFLDLLRRIRLYRKVNPAGDSMIG